VSGSERAVFLIGSGASRDADIPGVAEITRVVRSGDGVFRGSDGVFRVDKSHPNFDLLSYAKDVERVLACISAFDAVAARFYGYWKIAGTLDYEELANIAGRLDDALLMEREDAALEPLITQLAASLTSGDVCELSRLVSAVREYIVDVTWSMLDRTPSETRHLAVLLDACREVGTVDVFTLNHDLVIEKALHDAGIDYSDGFERHDCDLRIWSDSYSAPVRLFKLHGSISWWGFQLPDEDWRGYVTAQVTNGDAFHASVSAGGLHTPHDMRPVFLAGTFGKSYGYETWIFPDQHFRLHEALQGANRLIVIGYGFRDKAINSRLIGWLSGAKDNRVVIVHPQPKEIQGHARPAIALALPRWIDEGRVRFVRAWVKDATWDAVKAELG
jgi:hypothetical protein